MQHSTISDLAAKTNVFSNAIYKPACLKWYIFVVFRFISFRFVVFLSAEEPFTGKLAKKHSYRSIVLLEPCDFGAE